jgi:hypothetical protein
MESRGTGGGKFSTLYWLWFGFNFVCTSFKLYWDTYISWGLFDSQESGKWALRDKILYPNYFYYYAIIMNVVCRFWWLLTAFNTSVSSPALYSYSFVTFSAFLAFYRRF